MTRVYFVRHAQSDCRSGSDRERGLTPEGLEDRRVVLDFLRDKPVDAFYCSPYRRSLDTIQEAADHFGLAIRTDERVMKYPVMSTKQFTPSLPPKASTPTATSAASTPSAGQGPWTLKWNRIMSIMLTMRKSSMLESLMKDPRV